LLAIEAAVVGMLHCRAGRVRIRARDDARFFHAHDFDPQPSLLSRLPRRPKRLRLLAPPRLSPAAGRRRAAGLGARRVDVGESAPSAADPAEQIEAAGAQEYQKMMRDAAQQRALAPANHPQLIRLREIASASLRSPRPGIRAPPMALGVNLVGSAELNAFCMPAARSPSITASSKSSSSTTTRSLL